MNKGMGTRGAAGVPQEHSLPRRCQPRFPLHGIQVKDKRRARLGDCHSQEPDSEAAKAKGQARPEAAEPFSGGSWGSAPSVLPLPRLRGWAGPARGLSCGLNGQGKGKQSRDPRKERAGSGRAAASAGAALAPSGGGGASPGCAPRDGQLQQKTWQNRIYFAF